MFSRILAALAVIVTLTGLVAGCAKKGAERPTVNQSPFADLKGPAPETPAKDFEEATMYVLDGSGSKAEIPVKYCDYLKWSPEHPQGSCFVRVKMADVNGFHEMYAKYYDAYTFGLKKADGYFLCKSQCPCAVEEDAEGDILIWYGDMLKIDLKGRTPAEAFREEVPNRTMVRTQGMPGKDIIGKLEKCKTMEEAGRVLKNEKRFAVYLLDEGTGKHFAPRYLGNAKPYASLDEWQIKAQVAGKMLYVFKEFDGGETYLGPWSNDAVRVEARGGAITELSMASIQNGIGDWINEPEPPTKEQVEQAAKEQF